MAEPAAGEHPAADPAALSTGYEQLRGRVLAGRADGWRLGHGVLTGRGMVAWIAARAAAAPAAEVATPPPELPGAALMPSRSTPTPRPPTDAPSSLPGTGQIVAVLTQMALAHA